MIKHVSGFTVVVLACLVLGGCQPKTGLLTESLQPTDADKAKDTASAPVGSHSPNIADARPSSEVVDITFEDINLGMQADMAFRPFMLTDRVNELNGRHVRISGYIDGGVAQARGIQEFVLLRSRRTGRSFG